MSNKVRYPVHGTIQAPDSQTMRIRTRIQATEQDRMVLETLGIYFSSIAGKDLAQRCKNASNHIKDDWADRKRSITKDCSSRWAGYITKKNNDAWNTARRNQLRHLTDLEKAIETIQSKLALPVHSSSERKTLKEKETEQAKKDKRNPRKLLFGYRTQHEHAMKRQRLNHLKSERDQLKRDINESVVHITRGGKKLLKNRLYLEDAGIDNATWRTKWQANRLSFGANGESGTIYGNSTIRVAPDGTVEIDVPEQFCYLANNTKRGTTRYQLDAKAIFSYRHEEWLSQVTTRRAIAYEIVFGANSRIYLDASFTPKSTQSVPTLTELLKNQKLRILSVDLNYGFVAPAIIDRSGNMVDHLDHIPFVVDGLSASRRDGHLRQTIIEILNLADSYKCRMIVMENLGFDEMRSIGREKQKSSPWFRRVVCGMPTAKFRDRMIAMASRRGIAVVGVPAAYSSIWGNQYWRDAISSPKHKVSGHTAAAVVIGRRSLGQRARRKIQASPGVTAPDQRIEEVGQPAGVESYQVEDVNGKESECKKTQNMTLRHEGLGIVPVRPKMPGHISGRSRSAKTVWADPVSLDGT
jgi:hypothetical protein